MLRLADRSVSSRVARIQCRSGLEQHDFDLGVRIGFMHDSFRNDDHLAGLHPFRSIPKVHSEAAPNDEEQFILELVGVPDKVTAKLDEFHLLAIELSNDFGRPLIREEVQLFCKVYFVKHGEPAMNS